MVGLPFDNEKFTVLPPHFTDELLAEMNDDYWTKIVDNYSTLPNGMKTALPFLLASVLHHEDFLRQNLSSRHPIFSSRVFTHNLLLDKMRKKTLLGYGHCSQTDLKATGIPPHLAIAARLADVVEKIKKLKKEMEMQINGLKEELMDLKKTFKHEVAEAVTEELTENVTIDGVAPVSLRSINQAMDEKLDKKLDALEERLVNRIGKKSEEQAAASEDPSTEPLWKTWDWGDGLICHYVPKGWEFPTGLTVKSLWDLWWFGDRDTGIRPLHKIDFSNELRGPYCNMRLSRAKSVAEYCTSLVHELQLLPEGVKKYEEVPIEDSDRIFKEMFEEHAIPRLYAGKEETGRAMEICYGTLYKYVPKTKRQVKRTRR